MPSVRASSPVLVLRASTVVARTTIEPHLCASLVGNGAKAVTLGQHKRVEIGETGIHRTQQRRAIAEHCHIVSCKQRAPAFDPGGNEGIVVCCTRCQPFAMDHIGLGDREGRLGIDGALIFGFTAHPDSVSLWIHMDRLHPRVHHAARRRRARAQHSQHFSQVRAAAENSTAWSCLRSNTAEAHRQEPEVHKEQAAADVTAR